MVNPCYYDPHRGLHLALIYDLISWTGITDKTVKRKAENLVEFILSRDYQEHVKPGFGTVKAAPHRYYAMGWSIHVPGWKSPQNHERVAQLMRLMTFFAHFRTACTSQWFKRSLVWLEGFVKDDGVCWIPKEALRGGALSYWVAGGRIELEPKPRIYRKRVLEATFRLLVIRKHAFVL